MGASTAALFQNASPVVGIFAAALFLGEELIWQYFLSLCLVIGGVVLGAGILSLPDFTKNRPDEIGSSAKGMSYLICYLCTVS